MMCHWKMRSISVPEAASLTRFCREQLAEAEGKLEQLVEAANGEVHITSLDAG